MERINPEADEGALTKHLVTRFNVAQVYILNLLVNHTCLHVKCAPQKTPLLLVIIHLKQNYA